jgi:UDP-N-acetylmuramoyl-tripeptide--D-alanyl-D-alanine ligase
MNTVELYELYIKYPSITIDTRKVFKNVIFFGVGTKNELGVHRGCQFAAEALAAGAAFVVINDPVLKAAHLDDNQWILVDDCELSLQQLARHHREQLNIPVIAIAGSNGKTTTRALVELILGQKYRCFATPGNLNNHLGLPLSLLQINAEHEIAVLEVGANHVGETLYLCQLLQPTYGLVTNCGKDHLGEYGSFENVIKANKELYDYFEKVGGLVFVNGRDDILMEISEQCPQRIIYGDDENTLRGEVIQSPMLEIRLWINEDSRDIKTALFGDFWRDSVLSAAQIGYQFGLSIDQIKWGIEAYRPDALRSELIEWNGHSVLLDCYNANPSSMEVFIHAAQRSPELPKILILGEMLELGIYTEEEHQYLLDKVIDEKRFDKILLVGKEFSKINIPQSSKIKHFESTLLAQRWWFSEVFIQGCCIYVKGSRGNKLESLFGR